MLRLGRLGAPQHAAKTLCGSSSGRCPVNMSEPEPPATMQTDGGNTWLVRNSRETLPYGAEFRYHAGHTQAF